MSVLRLRQRLLFLSGCNLARRTVALRDSVPALRGQPSFLLLKASNTTSVASPNVPARDVYGVGTNERTKHIVNHLHCYPRHHPQSQPIAEAGWPRLPPLRYNAKIRIRHKPPPSITTPTPHQHHPLLTPFTFGFSAALKPKTQPQHPASQPATLAAAYPTQPKPQQQQQQQKRPYKKTSKRYPSVHPVSNSK